MKVENVIRMKKVADFSLYTHATDREHAHMVYKDINLKTAYVINYCNCCPNCVLMLSTMRLPQC